jgi:hypothetical protein
MGSRMAVLGVLIGCAASPRLSPSYLAGQLTGRVTTPDGRPVPEVYVVVRAPPWPQHGGTTDADGRYASIAPAGEVEVEVQHTQAPKLHARVAPGAITTLDIVLRTLDCSPGARRRPASNPVFAIHESLRVPGLLTYGARVTDTNPQPTFVAVGDCLGDPELDRVELLRRAGWDRASPAEREALALAWLRDVVYAFEAVKGYKVRTLDTGFIDVEAWPERQRHMMMPLVTEHVEWRFDPDGELHGPLVLDAPL